MSDFGAKLPHVIGFIFQSPKTLELKPRWIFIRFRKPNLKRLESLTDAAQMDQRDYAESWSWVYFMLHSPPERREILTSYLADFRAKGTGQPLSVRLASLQAEPEKPLTPYIATLKKETTVK